MTPNPHPHHRWGLPKGPQGRFSRDDPNPATHGPARPARPLQGVPQPDERTPIAARIESQLHAVVDHTLEQVAALQIEAISDAQDQAREEKRRERETFEKVLEGLSQHANGLDQLARSVNSIASSLQRELEEIDAAVAKLTGVSSALDGEAPDAP